MHRNGDKKPAAHIDITDCHDMSQFRLLIASELDILSHNDIRIYSDKGQELIADEDVWATPKNGFVFITTRSTPIDSHRLDEAFNYRNCLVPYEIVKLLGEVFIVEMMKLRADLEK